MTYLVFETEQQCIETLNNINLWMNYDGINRYWDEVHYNEWVEKWWLADPTRRLKAEYKPLVAMFREEHEDDWFSNPNPETPETNYKKGGK